MALAPTGPRSPVPDFSRGRRSPVEQPAGEVDTHDRADFVAGEEATLPLESAAGDAALVRVAGQQAEIEGALVVIFLLAGSIKLVLPPEVLTAQLPFPGWFLRFVGLAELMGAVGLILPGVLRIRPGLTPLAAAGLVIIMIGATTLTLALGQVVPALVPLAVGLLAAFVAYGRWPATRGLW